MNALVTLNYILNTKLLANDLRYCLVSKDKKPFRIDGSPCRPNVDTDFVDLTTLAEVIDLENYAGIGISVTASKISAIDVDHCFSEPFDITSGDERAKYFIEQFKDIAYIEFSFSGTGLRILFITDTIKDYTKTYYIKNSQYNIEYYQHSGSARYVTITGRAIANNTIQKIEVRHLLGFLVKFMKKPEFKHNYIEEKEETRTLNELLIEAKRLYLKNIQFQRLWFKKAPGSHSNESELDYELIAFIYEKITTDRDMVRQIFEASDYYKSKDFKHISKWKKDDYRYFNFQFDEMKKRH